MAYQHTMPKVYQSRPYNDTAEEKTIDAMISVYIKYIYLSGTCVELVPDRQIRPSDTTYRRRFTVFCLLKGSTHVRREYWYVYLTWQALQQESPSRRSKKEERNEKMQYDHLGLICTYAKLKWWNIYLVADCGNHPFWTSSNERTVFGFFFSFENWSLEKR